MALGLSANQNLRELNAPIAFSTLFNPVNYNDLVIFQGASVSRPSLLSLIGSTANINSTLNGLTALNNSKFDVSGRSGNLQSAFGITANSFTINGLPLRSTTINPWSLTGGVLTTTRAVTRSLRVNGTFRVTGIQTGGFVDATVGIRIKIAGSTMVRSFIVRLKQ